jgi:hypothetical protein
MHCLERWLFWEKVVGIGIAGYEVNNAVGVNTIPSVNLIAVLPSSFVIETPSANTPILDP